MHQFHPNGPLETPMSQLPRLTEREEADDGLAAEVGLRPHRRLTISANFHAQRCCDPRSIHYRWPSTPSQPYRARPPQRQ